MTRRPLIAVLALIPPGAAQAQNVAEVQVAPPSITIRVGERSGLLATAFDRIGNVIPTVRLIWSSNNVNVARVDNNGTVTGVGNGVAIVEARFGTRKGQAAVQVVGGPPPRPSSRLPPPLPLSSRPPSVRIPSRASRQAQGPPRHCASNPALSISSRPRTPACPRGRCARTARRRRRCS